MSPQKSKIKLDQKVDSQQKSSLLQPQVTGPHISPITVQPQVAALLPQSIKLFTV